VDFDDYDGFSDDKKSSSNEKNNSLFETDFGKTEVEKTTNYVTDQNSKKK
jgi:hypothetical protein